MIKVLLWDVDGTLLDFLAAEKVAMKKCFEKNLKKSKGEKHYGKLSNS